MRYFDRIAADVDMQPILEELAQNADAWDAQVGRQERAAPQRETASIPIRGGRKSMVRGRRNRDVLETRWTTISRRLPRIRAFIEATARRLDADLARARVVRLAPQSRVYAHFDRGDYYQHHDRYHLVLQSPAGSPMRAGDEAVRMREGELWWFDNKALHDAINESDEPRVHLIFDLRPRTASGRHSPPTPPTGLEDETRPLDALLDEARAAASEGEAAIVAQAVRLYLIGRRDPDAWVGFLEGHDLEPTSEGFRPLRSIHALIDPAASRQAIRHRARATVWALERIEQGQLRWPDVAATIEAEGDVAEVADAWKQAQAATEMTG